MIQITVPDGSVRDYNKGASAMDVPLFAGDYYVVVSCEAVDAAMTFDISIDATTMPDPECAMNEFPADGAIEVLGHRFN